MYCCHGGPLLGHRRRAARPLASARSSMGFSMSPVSRKERWPKVRRMASESLFLGLSGRHVVGWRREDLDARAAKIEAPAALHGDDLYSLVRALSFAPETRLSLGGAWRRSTVRRDESSRSGPAIRRRGRHGRASAPPRPSCGWSGSTDKARRHPRQYRSWIWRVDRKSDSRRHPPASACRLGTRPAGCRPGPTSIAVSSSWPRPHTGWERVPVEQNE